jgi:hypothetical protein
VRLWSFHPEQLDAAGLVAAWREALLAQAVLAGRTRGYRRHPQLERFLSCAEPLDAIGEYLRVLHGDSLRRGYRFDASRIDRAAGRPVGRIVVPRGQVEYEWALFRRKAAARDRAAFERIAGIAFPRLHPLFDLVEGGVAGWERPKAPGQG